MAFNSAIGFELFSLAALSARPRRGDDESNHERHHRRGDGAAFVARSGGLIPLILGALRFSSEEHGVLEIEYGISLFAFANIVLFAAVIWWNAKLLFQAEQERLQAMEKLKRLTRDLERSNGDLQQFAYAASHDLNEPLRMITSHLELLNNRARGRLGAEEEEFIGYAVDGARRMQGLIQDLLEYARVDTRGRPLEPTDSERVLETVLANLKLAVSESRAVIDHEPLPVVKGDRAQLMLVFQNLIGNAIKFHGKAGTSHSHQGAAGHLGDWVFQVKDNGIGIEPRNFHCGCLFCFNVCTHAGNIRARGWALQFAKKIVERHGGRIWVESEPNEGSTFFFTLPASNENQV